MALFRVANERAQFDAASNDARDQYGAGIRFTQEGNARVTTSAGTFYNQGIPMSGTGQVAIVDATAGLPSGTIYHNGLPMSDDKVCVSKNATAVVSNGLPFDSAGALAADINFDLNFIGTDTLNSSVTFTRASTATYFNSAGVLTSAAINEARFDYNPATLAARGLLIEEQRTNLMLYSEQYDNAAWTKETSVSVSANTTVAPDGNTTADTVTANAGFSIYQSVTATIGTTYCQSVFIKAGTATSILFRDDTGAGRNITINPSTGAITATGGTLVTSGSQAIGNGWWRYWFAYVADTTVVRGLLRPSGGGAAQTFIVWGAQTEAGAFPTSYIPTTTTALTRSADVASVNTLSPWYNATEGTLFAEGTVGYTVPGSKFAILASLNDGTSNNRIDVGYLTASAAALEVAVGGVNQVGMYPSNTSATRKVAGAYKLDDFAVSVNGSSPQTDTTGTVPIVDRLRLGDRTGLTGNILSGWLRRVSYYPRKLSSAELQAITT